MKTLKLLIILFCALLLPKIASAQSMPTSDEKELKVIPAFTVLTAHQSTVVEELKALRTRFTDTYSPVIRKKRELDITQREMAKILIMPKSQRIKLSDCYGKIIIRKITSEAALLQLLDRQTVTATQVLKASQELQAIENEISEILLK